MDEDGNKQLSKEELIEGFEAMGFEFEEEEVDEIISKLDTDESGTIDLTEFITAIRVRFLLIIIVDKFKDISSFL